MGLVWAAPSLIATQLKTVDMSYGKSLRCYLILYFPWLITGDLNVVVNPEEKEGGRPFDSHLALPFLEFMFDANFLDLSFE